MTPDLSVHIAGLKLRNPILLASGTVGYGFEISEHVDLNKLGGVVAKSISLKPRKGNPPPRVTETPSGMINAIGLANVGVDEFVEKKIPFLKKFDCALVANIAASTIEEYEELARTLDGVEEIDAIEVNVSCPNVKDGGLSFGNDADAVGNVTRRTRKATSKPLIVKLSPNVPNVAAFAKRVKDEGGDAVTAINTLVGTAFNIHTSKPKIANVVGGLSGPAIKPVALAKVLEISRSVDIPIFGVGGIMSWEDVAEFMIVGASAVQIGTANFVNPNIGERVLEGLRDYCVNRGLERLSDVTASYKI
jgi:dihydroorotate dehydrogenase (NAD+) catalytic subunit